MGAAVRIYPYEHPGGKDDRDYLLLVDSSLGAALNGVGGAGLTAFSVAIAEAWFPQEGRLFATAVGFVSAVQGHRINFSFASIIRSILVGTVVPYSSVQGDCH